jgi:hypothetical protein
MTILLIRVLPLAGLGGVIAALMAGDRAAVQPLLLVTILLAPVLLPRRLLYPSDGGSAPDDSDTDNGGGRGPRPEPPKPPDTPRGGLPLPDAQPARVRLRDHGRPVLTPGRSRRPAREPERTPERDRPSRRVSR